LGIAQARANVRTTTTPRSCNRPRTPKSTAGISSARPGSSASTGPARASDSDLVPNLAALFANVFDTG
jgi:hypothetical protein